MTTSHGVNLCKGIMALVNQVKRAMHMKVSNGSNVLFWEDTWCCPRLLREEVLSISNIDLAKEASVAECWIREGDSGNWNVPLRRRLNDWEIEDMIKLLNYINHIHPCSDREDRRVWVLKLRGFSL